MPTEKQRVDPQDAAAIQRLSGMLKMVQGGEWTFAKTVHWLLDTHGGARALHPSGPWTCKCCLRTVTLKPRRPGISSWRACSHCGTHYWVLLVHVDWAQVDESLATFRTDQRIPTDRVGHVTTPLPTEWSACIPAGHLNEDYLVIWAWDVGRKVG